MKTILTDAGRAILARALDGAQIQFTHAEFGSGQWTTQDDEQLHRDIAAATSLRNPITGADFDDTDQIEPIGDGTGTVTVENHFVLLSTQFKNTGVTNGFHITEIGYYVRDLAATDDPETEEVDETEPFLYAVCVCDWSEAAYVAPQDVETATFKHECHIYVGDVADVTAILSNYIDAAPLELVEDHIRKRNNPHGVTKDQVELGHVPNVATHNQRPTFTEADVLENIDGTEQSGSASEDEWYGKDTLGTILGKVQKAISTLIAHIANKANPHGVTASQVSAAPIEHKHSAQDITNDVLPTNHGGTGTSSGYGFTGSGYQCRGYAYLMGEKVGNKENQNRLIMQWGRVKVDSTSADVTFQKEFANTDYVLLFPTCGKEFVPVWQNPDKRTTGFTMNKTFGIAQGAWNPFSSLLEINTIFGTITIGKKLRDFFDNLFKGAQVADWLAIGQAKD